MPAQARVSCNDGKIMLGTGNIRIPYQPVTVNPAGGWTEFAPAGWDVEIIPDPEPRWSPYDVVEDSAGEVFIRTEAGTWQHALGQDIQPNRPLTRLVPAA